MSTPLNFIPKNIIPVVFFFHSDINSKCCRKDDDLEIKPTFKDPSQVENENKTTGIKIEPEEENVTDEVKEDIAEGIRKDILGETKEKKEVSEPIVEPEHKKGESEVEKKIREIKESFNCKFTLPDKTEWKDCVKILPQIIYKCDKIYEKDNDKIDQSKIQKELKDKFYIKLIYNGYNYYIIPEISKLKGTDIATEYKGDVTTAIGDNKNIMLYFVEGNDDTVNCSDIFLGLFAPNIDQYCKGEEFIGQCYKEIVSFINSVLSEYSSDILSGDTDYLCKVYREENKNSKDKKTAIISLSKNSRVIISYTQSSKNVIIKKNVVDILYCENNG